MNTFFSDAGHGWLSVKLEELTELNIKDKITSFSYMRGRSAYLEEDCDLSTYLNAKFQTKEEKRNFMQSVKESYSHHSPIRHYLPYKPQ